MIWDDCGRCFCVQQFPEDESRQCLIDQFGLGAPLATPPSNEIEHTLRFGFNASANPFRRGGISLDLRRSSAPPRQCKDSRALH
jgi:hypothetical protein